MNQSSTAFSSFFISGGTLRPDAPSYVERRADQELLAALQARDYSYVLTSRQMGKSSLMVRTADRLRQSGVAVAILDLTALGQNVTPEQWYGGLLEILGEQLDLDDELQEVWNRHSGTAPMRRFFTAVRRVIVPAHPDGIVLFIDEIDAVRALPFSTDELFGGIRECYDDRALHPELGRIAFCLLGVAMPTDLIQDPRTTPFNIGTRVELHDFTSEEAAPLAQGLAHRVKNPKTLLKRVLYWTAGHPYLTQRLCKAAAEDKRVNSPAEIDRLCAELFLGRRTRNAENNLVFVREQVLTGLLPGFAPGEARIAVLDAYERILRGKRLVEVGRDPVTELLRLSGIVRWDGARLHSRNRIYARVFDRDWVRAQMPDAELRRQQEAFRRGALRAGALGLVATGLIAWLAVTSAINEQMASKSNDDLESSLATQKVTLLQLEREKVRAQSLGASERKLRGIAEASERKANEKGREAEQHSRAAQQQKLRAETESERARRSLVQSFVGNGWRRAEAGDPAGALIWFTNALQREGADPERQAEHRVRIATFLRQCPRPTAAWVHSQELAASTFSPDGTRLLTAADGSIALREVRTGRAVSSHSRIRGFVQDACYAAGQAKVLVISGRAAQVWDAENGTLASQRMSHADGVNAAVFSRDGRHVATASEDATAQVWNARTGKPTTPPLVHARKVADCRFTPDTRSLITILDNRSVQVWDLAEATARKRAADYGGAALLEISPDSKLLACTDPGNERKIRLLRIGDSRIVSRIQLASTATSLAFSPDGRLLVTASHGSMAQVWDVRTAQTVGLPMRHQGAVLSAQFSPDGSRIVTTGEDCTARVWIAATGAPHSALLYHGSRISAASFCPDGRRVLTSSVDGMARLWDLARTDPALNHGNPGSSSAEVIYIDQDLGVYVTLGSGRQLRVWDLRSGRLREPPCPLNVVPGPITSLKDKTGHLWSVLDRRDLPVISRMPPAAGVSLKVGKGTGAVRSVAMDMSQQCVLTVDDWGWLQSWNSRTGDLLSTRRLTSRSVSFAAFSPDASQVVLVAAGTARVWSTRSARALTLATPAIGGGNQVTFSPDGRWVVLAANATVSWWDLARPTSGARSLRHGGNVSQVRISLDNRLIASASTDHVVYVTETPTGHTLFRLHHREAVAAVAFSPDGRRLCTASAEGELRVWDLRTGTPLSAELAFGTEASVLEFSRDGTEVLIGFGTGAVVRWSLRPDPRAAEDLVSLVEALTCHRLDQNSLIGPLPTARVRQNIRVDLSSSSQSAGLERREELAWHHREALACERSGDWVAAARHLDHLIAVAEPTPALLTRRATAHSAAGSWRLAVAAWRALLKRQPENHVTWYQFALALRCAGDERGYVDTCWQMLARFQEAEPPRPRDVSAWTCALGPNPQIKRALEVNSLLLRKEPDHKDWLNTQGALLYRAGEFRLAADTLRRAIKQRGNGGSVSDLLFLAMAEQRLNRKREARLHLEQAELQLTELGMRDAVDWEDRAEAELLLREAKALITSAS